MASAMANREEHDLLFGAVALQLGMVDRRSWLEAVAARDGAPARPIEARLRERSALSPADACLVREVVARLLDRDGGRLLPDFLVGLGEPEPTEPGPAVSCAPRCRSATDPGETRADGLGGDDGAEDDPYATVAVPCPSPTPAAASRFRPLRFHARGGLGEVWVARDGELNREVALKQIREQYADDPGGRARFVLEAEVTGGLEHPGIVPVYGLGCHADGRPYYAMRLIRGDSLKEAIDRFHACEVAARRAGPRELALRRLLRRLLDVCNALAYAHSRGVIHRDVKPSNVMLGPFGETLLVDWGLAKAVGRREDVDAPPCDGQATLAPGSGSSVEATAMGQRVGTPAYMAPEQAAGRLDEVGPASDVYSLGASLYAMLAGRAPFSGDDLADVLRRVERGDFPPPRSVSPWVDRALEAVCLRAMARSAGDRYGSARAMAEDIERWLADEPVHAWREPRGRAARRWVLRHQVAVAAVIVAVGTAVVSSEAYFTVRLQAARGRVEALESAEIGAVPELLNDLSPDRALVRGRLRVLADPPQPDPELRLRGALALLPDEPSRAESLARYVADPKATPEDVLVIRRALLQYGHGREAIGWATQLLPPPGAPLDGPALRTCGLLAGVEPDWPGWADYLDAVAQALTHDDPIWISGRAAVFRPIAARLAGPLRRIYADRSDPEARGLAFALLVEFALREPNPGRVEELAALVPEADPAHAARLLQQVPGEEDRRAMIAELAPMLGVPARFDDARAARQGRVAAMLARLGAPDRAWPLLRASDDPGARSELVRQLAAFGADPALIADRLLAEPDPAARRALVLALGAFDGEALPDGRRDALAVTLLDWYRNDPDPGLHSAIDWLVRRRWGLGGAIDAIRRELDGLGPAGGRGWYAGARGEMTFIVVRGPVEFAMGSTRRTDADRSRDEVFHRRRIGRSFALSAREVCAAEFAAFLREAPGLARRPEPEPSRAIPTGDCPAGAVSWYDAARFCNWVSSLEGIPKDQWCYPEPIGPGMALPDDLLDRTGYRLPTEAEWEYACRAGAASSRPFGGSDRLLGGHAWSIANADRTMHPVSSLMPNDLGFFDLLGNAAEWCHDAYREAPPPAGGDLVPDLPAAGPVSDDVARVLRGGSFHDDAPDLRSASRGRDRPGSIAITYGFRLARTLPSAPGPRPHAD